MYEVLHDQLGHAVVFLDPLVMSFIHFRLPTWPIRWHPTEEASFKLQASFTLTEGWQAKSPDSGD